MKVALDIGNVLVEIHWDEFLDELQINQGLENRFQAKALLQSTQVPIDLGQTTMKELFPELAQSWLETITVNPIMQNLVAALQAKGHEIALLSNIGSEHALKFLTEFQPTEDVIKFFSFEVGLVKPDPQYYLTFLNQNPGWEGCLYFDDRLDNLQAAEKLGFHSVHFALDQLSGDAWAELHSMLQSPL